MDVQDLERAKDVAAAKLATAESLSWLVGTLSGLCIHLGWGGWALPLAAGGATCSCVRITDITRPHTAP